MAFGTNDEVLDHPKGFGVNDEVLLSSVHLLNTTRKAPFPFDKLTNPHDPEQIRSLIDTRSTPTGPGWVNSLLGGLGSLSGPLEYGKDPINLPANFLNTLFSLVRGEPTVQERVPIIRPLNLEGLVQKPLEGVQQVLQDKNILPPGPIIVGPESPISGGAQAVEGAAGQLTDPQLLAQLPAFGGQATPLLNTIRMLVAGQMAKGAADANTETVQTFQDPDATTKDKAQALTSEALQILFAGKMSEHGIKYPEQVRSGLTGSDMNPNILHQDVVDSGGAVRNVRPSTGEVPIFGKQDEVVRPSIVVPGQGQPSEVVSDSAAKPLERSTEGQSIVQPSIQGLQAKPGVLKTASDFLIERDQKNKEARPLTGGQFSELFRRTPAKEELPIQPVTPSTVTEEVKPLDREKPLEPDLQVTVQAENGVPGSGYVQIDKVKEGNNEWSKGPKTLKEEGFEVPDFSKLPQGRYTVKRANELLAKGEKGKVPLAAAVEDRGPQGGNISTLGFLDPAWWKGALGFGEKAKVEGMQMYNRMRNKLGEKSAAWNALDTDAFKAFLKEGPKTTEEVRKWVEDNGPKVEVRKFALGANTDIQRKLAGVEHTLDTMYPAWRRDGLKAIDKIAEPVRDQYTDLINERDRLSGLGSNLPVGESHWSSIAPKPESSMPGYTEIAVVKPDKSRTGVFTKATSNQFPESHNFPPNTLGWVRGYMDVVGGKKVFHVIELQSDWAQRQHEAKQEFLDRGLKAGNKTREQLEQIYKDKPTYSHDDLLPHYERLALKAAIEHAREQGAEGVVISDAETAMMTEGHDRAAGYDGHGEVNEIPQEPGMRLHYDKTMPKIMEELTGEKGERMSMGEHKMAMEQHNRPYPSESDEFGKTPRKDLIFRNLDSTPKTDVSGRLYRIDKANKDFSLFGSDKPKAAEPTPIESRGAKGGNISSFGILDPANIKQAAKDVSEAGKNLVRFYSEPIVERLGRIGGPISKKVSEEANEIVSKAKGYYGELTPTLDPAKKAAGKAYRGGTTWVRDLNKVTDRAATNNFFAQNEGTKVAPPEARDMLNKVNKANREIGYLAAKASPGFVATGKLQRMLSSYGVDVIRRGGGKAWTAWTEGVAKANGVNVADVQTFFRRWKAEIDKPGPDVATLDKINQDFVRKFPKTITHIKPGVAWHEVTISDPFSYLENAAQRTAHAAAFRDVYKPGSGLLDATRKGVLAELGTDRYNGEFDNLVRALQGHPVDSFTSSWNAPDTLLGGAARMVGQTVGQPLRALMLTGNALTNMGEAITGGPAIFMGFHNSLPATIKAMGPAFYRQLESNGAVNRAMQNYAFDPTSPVRSLTRQLGNNLRRATFQQIVNELQEAQAAASAKHLTDRIRASDLSPYESNRAVAVMRAMGISEPNARAAVEGKAPDILNQFERKSASWLTAGNQAMAERSRLGASRAFNELFWFHSYPQMAMNQLRSVMGNFIEDVGRGNKSQAFHNAALLGRLISGRTMQGIVTKGIMALAVGGLFGIKEQKQEAKDEISRFAVDSFLASMGGPMYAIKRAAENGGDSSTVGAALGSMVAPLNIAGEMYDASFGNGRYEGLTPQEKLGKFFQTKTPGYQVLQGGMALAGLSQQDQQLEVAKKAFYRWRRDQMGWQKTTGSLDDQEGVMFRAQMRRAVAALENGQDWKAELTKAGTPKQVAGSLYGRTLLVSPEGKGFSDEQLDALGKHIGPELVDKLQIHDAMIREVARTLSSDKDFDKMVEKPTGKFEVDFETGTKRQEHVLKQLSPEVQQFVKDNNLNISTYDPSIPKFGGKTQLTTKENPQLEKFTVEEYQKFLDKLMARGERFTGLTQKRKDELVSEGLEQFRNRAQARTRTAKREQQPLQ